MNSRLFYLCLTIVLILQIAPAGTLEDIRRKLGKTDPGARQNQEPYYEIRGLRPTNIQNWVRVDESGGLRDLHAIEAQIKINARGDDLMVPIAYCYFYNRDKQLMRRQVANWVYGQSMRGFSQVKEISVKGGKRTQILFSYPSGYDYKYAVCVIGDEKAVAVEAYPKSAKWQEFDFDEKPIALKNN